ncbi:hypothetical protein SAMN05216428_102372 [Nitrosospira sp. Nsp11]|uniref:hypothetical protein n=1 Tax=Nitrosospira sp. Nsp11 TaxID=1855338 RepID=UPI00090FEB37|nr:hypothetical protein [Nitrosospira sp. Nsp11]SHL42736.1 hypothetical protein SAMN05216428_102372 [Nitrosospira sp. Nsp11]
MPQVKYTAAGIKTDSIRGVGLRWEPGQVRNVTAEVAERLLVYTDTWAEVKESPVGAENAPSDEIGLVQDEKPAEEPLPVVNFHAMDKKALLEFAETKYGEKFDKRKSEIDLRHRVIDLAAKHAMEAE